MRPQTSSSRLAQWTLAALLVAGIASGATTRAAQPPSLQKLFESGQYAALVERAADGRGTSAEDTYLAALAYLKLENAAGATGELRRLQDDGDPGWQQVGASAAATLERNFDQAVAAGRRAVELAESNPYAHYQLGLAAAAAGDFAVAAEAFERATALKPDFAYAHYYAAQAHQRQRNQARAADHYQYFLNLAPESPDRAAVVAILRTLRK